MQEVLHYCAFSGTKSKTNFSTIFDLYNTDAFLIQTDMLFAGREFCFGKNCARGLRPRTALKTEGTVLPNTDRPRPANDVFIFFSTVLL